MKIHGREICFLRTVEASMAVTAICPERKIANLGTLFATDNDMDAYKMMIKFITILNTGYEKHKAFEEDDYKADPITEEELLNVTEETMYKLFDEALAAWSGEKQTVETEPVKKSSKKKTAVTSD